MMAKMWDGGLVFPIQIFAVFSDGEKGFFFFVPSFNVPAAAAVRPSLRPAVNRSLTLLTVELPFLPCYATHSPLSHRAPPSLPGLLSTLYTGGKESPSLFLMVVVVRWRQAGGRSVGPLSDDGGGGFSHVLLSPSLSSCSSSLLLLPWMYAGGGEPAPRPPYVQGTPYTHFCAPSVHPPPAP